VNGCSLKLLKAIPSRTFDLVFADPPYNLQIGEKLKRPDNSKVNGVNDKWDQFKNFKDYDNFSKNWLTECKRILKDNGSIWVIGSYHNIFRIGYHMQNLDYWILNDVIWKKNNPMPNFREIIVMFEVFELIPFIIYTIDFTIIRSFQLFSNLQIVGRVCKN